MSWCTSCSSSFSQPLKARKTTPDNVGHGILRTAGHRSCSSLQLAARPDSFSGTYSDQWPPPVVRAYAPGVLTTHDIRSMPRPRDKLPTAPRFIGPRRRPGVRAKVHKASQRDSNLHLRHPTRITPLPMCFCHTRVPAGTNANLQYYGMWLGRSITCRFLGLGFSPSGQRHRPPRPLPPLASPNPRGPSLQPQGFERWLLRMTRRLLSR
ncbi:hypothetical protein C8Q80DRAFT_580876 [Daedaleopsis nitida]|nr:hypothetical protein C8Q80DRAFT_580876 [Daedaleopsis nitida]